MPNQSNPLVALLTISEVCSMLRVTRWAIRSYVASGQLRAYRLGPRFLRFEPRDVQNFLLTGLVKPKA